MPTSRRTILFTILFMFAMLLAGAITAAALLRPDATTSHNIVTVCDRGHNEIFINGTAGTTLELDYQVAVINDPTGTMTVTDRNDAISNKLIYGQVYQVTIHPAGFGKHPLNPSRPMASSFTRIPDTGDLVIAPCPKAPTA